MKKALPLLLVFFIPFFLQKATLGFHPSKLQISLPYYSDWEGPPPSSETLTILSQPFHYLARGNQSYAFESEDKAYVLKIFRYHRPRMPFVQALKKLYPRKKEKDPLLTKVDKTFKAYVLAITKAPDWTEILHIHLNLTRGALAPISLTDPMGRHWNLPLDRVRFVLQKKAAPFKKTLLAAIESHNDVEAKALIDSFLTLLQERSSRGIRNSDPNMGPNFGFIGQKAIEIDCGNYRWNPDLFEPENQLAEIHRFASQLQSWLRIHSPDYADYTERAFQLLVEKIQRE